MFKKLFRTASVLISTCLFCAGISAQTLTIGSYVYTLDATPVDAQATTTTKNFYNYMLSQYGKRIISGQTYGNYTDVVNATGKHPLLYDSDFQTYTQGYSYNWVNGGFAFGAVDNGNSENAIAWYNNTTNKKGIVAFQWHWHSPSGGTVGTNTFDKSNTTFSAARAVVTTNPEYTQIIQDIDAIAVQLKKFSDADIPVLFRPLHEASGSGANDGSGAWFWWGGSGNTVCKQLYDIIRTRLITYHGLHNIIWVWGSPESSWYPGNTKVDIMGGIDSYPGLGNYQTEKSWFSVIYNTSGGHKMLAMTENGAIPTPQACMDSTVTWSYFMTWYDNYTTSNSSQHLLDVYNSPFVATLENRDAALNNIPNGTYKITAKNSGMALDVSGGATSDGTSIIQWPYGGGNNQKWFVKSLGGGVYSIKNVNSGKSLDVTGASTADGTYIDQWTYSGNSNQTWTMPSAATSGYYKIVSVNSNKCVDVYNASTAQGALIDQWTCSGNDNQSFAFTLLSSATAREEADFEEEPVSAAFAVYPNPSSGLFTVKQSGAFDYTIQNTTGSTVEKGNGSDLVFVGKNLVPGVYFLQVHSSQGIKQVKLLKD